MENVVVKASKKSAKDTDQNNRNNVQCTVPNRDIADIKHDQPSSSEEPALSAIAYFDEGPEHHHHNCCAEESSP